jgi:hypothetical protein
MLPLGRRGGSINAMTYQDNIPGGMVVLGDVSGKTGTPSISLQGSRESIHPDARHYDHYSL